MAVTVTSLVPLIVKPARVTNKMERVSRANLDGLICIVIKVSDCFLSWDILPIMKILNV